ncbi:MAG: hydantoinase B/oxoprolinase family protein [Pseudomonadota bacterium]
MTPSPRRVDLATSAVVGEALRAVVREMRRAIVKSAYSSIIYEGYDFSCVLLDGQGRLVAESGEDHPFHIVPVAIAVDEALKRHAVLRDDEMVLHNDPYTGGTHLNDIAVIQPVSIDGVRTFHIVVRSHWGDVGGMSPGSLNGAAEEVLQEGLRLDYIKLPREGRSEVMRLIFDNVRVTEEALADFRSVLGVIRVAERRLKELARTHGARTLRDAMEDLLDIGERRIRAAIRGLADGDYAHVGYLDGAARTPHPLRVKVRLTVAGDHLTADFHGSSPQAPAPLNAGPAIARTSVLTVVKSFLDPDGAVTSGTLRAIDVALPPRSIVNAAYPAPCGGLNEVRFACDAAVMGALGAAIPDRMTGDVRGTSNHAYIGGDGFIFYEYPSGGTGAWASGDGNPAVRAFNEGENVSIQSAEVVEAIYPLRILRSGIRADSGGPGRHRGGVGLRRDVQVLTRGARLSLLSDRNVVPPAGVCGGRSGAPNRFSVIRDGREIAPGDFPGKAANFPLEPGDVVRMRSSGGGGWGDPAERPPEALEADLADGYVTPEGLAAWRSPAPEAALIRDGDLDEADCRVSADLAAELDLDAGDLIELLAPSGPSIRVWVRGVDRDASGLAVRLSAEVRVADARRVVRLSSFGRGRTAPDLP